MRRALGTTGIVLAVLLTSAAAAPAQPLAWSIQRAPLFIGWPDTTQLVVFNFATGVSEASFAIPEGIAHPLGAGPGANTGVLTPDGRYYLLPTTVGIARFATAPPAFDRILGEGVSVEGLAVEPSGVRLHASGAFGHAVLDWETGTVLSVECCTRPRILFSPDARTSVYLEGIGAWPNVSETHIRTFSEPEHALRWSAAVPGRVDGATLGNTYVAFQNGGEVLVWSLVHESERMSLPGPAAGLAWRDEELLISRSYYGDSRTHHLNAFRPSTSSERVLLELPASEIGESGAGAIYVSHDGRHAYWFRHQRLLFLTATTYHIVDLEVSQMIREGGIRDGRSGLTLEPASLCLFSVASEASAPAEGGTVGVDVTPGPACRSWTAPPGLNPGPHIGPATILLPVAPNPESDVRAFDVGLGGQRVRIHQPSAVPGPPTLVFGLTDHRVSFTWAPTVGGGITSWVIRGARSGGALVDVAIVDASTRTWTSPPLPSGSYEVEVLAANAGGLSASSNRVRFSVDVPELPEPPEGLTASVVEESVSLAWAASPHGPAPSAYVIEATNSPGNGHWPVATTFMPSLTIPAVSGTWSVRVRAQTAGGLSPPSAPVVVTTSHCTAPPGPPGSVWSVSTGEAATVRWSAPASGGAHEYVVDIGSVLGAADLGQFTVSGAAQEFTGPTPRWPARAIVQIRARNACGVSSASNPVAVPGS